MLLYVHAEAVPEGFGFGCGATATKCSQKPVRPQIFRISSYDNQNVNDQGAMRIHVGQKPLYNPRMPSFLYVLIRHSRDDL
jgi:hypothetical protein